jgi:uncharacterized membrane protein YidH (DUF202 family)
MTKNKEKTDKLEKIAIVLIIIGGLIALYGFWRYL